MKKLRIVWVVLAGLFLSVLSAGVAFAAADAQETIRADNGWQRGEQRVFVPYAAPDAQLTIYAQDGWQRGGQNVFVPQGERVWVQPHGTWSNGSNSGVGPQGYTASQSTGFMQYCKWPASGTQRLPFGRLIARTSINSNKYLLWDAGHAGWIYGPGKLYFRINERDGQCLDNNWGYIDVDLYAWWLQ